MIDHLNMKDSGGVALQMLGRIEDQLRQHPEFAARLEDSDVFCADLHDVRGLIRDAPGNDVQAYLVGILSMRMQLFNVVQ